MRRLALLPLHASPAPAATPPFRALDDLPEPPPPPPVWPSVLVGALFAAAVALLIWWFTSPAAAMPFCSGASRVTCVVDGDTVWIDGEKIRLADIDAPEIEAPCVDARVKAALAAGRLAELLGRGGYVIARGDPVDGRQQDRFGRSLAVILVDGVSVGSVLVDEELARPWTGRRENWC